jgi:TATA-binding protein-associated factor Taf7
MEGYCSTGQSPQRAAVPVEEEEEEEGEEEEEEEEEEEDRGRQHAKKQRSILRIEVDAEGLIFTYRTNTTTASTYRLYIQPQQRWKS